VCGGRHGCRGETEHDIGNRPHPGICFAPVRLNGSAAQSSADLGEDRAVDLADAAMTVFHRKRRRRRRFLDRLVLGFDPPCPAPPVRDRMPSGWRLLNSGPRDPVLEHQSPAPAGRESGGGRRRFR